jgi:plasmid stabilization system protein ParE
VRPIVWRKRALSDLDEIHDWLASIEGAKPDRAIRRIRNAVNTLARLGDIGRPSRVEGMRELSVRGAPYVIAYRFDGERIDVLAVYHTSQDRS